MSRPLELATAPARRLPDWLRRDLASGHGATATGTLLKDLALHTICESGRCPNRDECYSQRTATFMILGDICTRSCRFCSVSTGKPEIVDMDEPARVAEAAKTLGLKHVVVTSVNRDDLPDEGVSHFVEVIRCLRAIVPGIIIEVLTPDFKRTQPEALRTLLAAGPDIVNHNIETVPGLYRRVRPQADYEKSLSYFTELKKITNKVLTKSGLMLGLGEKKTEVLRVLSDLKQAGCDMLTLGQYLQSSSLGLPVQEYLHPDTFFEYKSEALAMGFGWVESGPFVRSSFHAKDSFAALQKVLKQRKEG